MVNEYRWERREKRRQAERSRMHKSGYAYLSAIPNAERKRHAALLERAARRAQGEKV